MADNKMEKSIKEAIGKSLNEFNKRIGMAKLIKDNKNQDRILKGILSQVNDENIEKTEKSNVITLDNSTDGIVELQEIKGDTNVNVSKIEKETPITHVIDDRNGNVISLDGITEGAINIDDIQGNTMVNCNKDTDKELILMPNLDTNGYSNVTLTEGIDGGKVDVSLEGNTMVNVCEQEDPIAITKSYTVDTGNHIALQGEYDGKCRPNIYGNTLVNIITSFDYVSMGEGNIGDGKYDYSTGSYKDVGNNLSRHLGYSVVAKPNTLYTVIANIKTNTLDNNFALIGWNITSDNSQVLVPNGFTGQFVSTFTTASENLRNSWITDIWEENTTGTIELDSFMILEGDYTNKPIPDYFTGMKSSFEDKLVPENLSSSVSYNGGINKKYTTLCMVDASKLKRNTIYTTFIKNDGDEDIQVYSNDTAGNFNFSTFTISAKSSKVMIISTKDSELDTTKKVWLSLYATETLPQNISAYLVEGDYTNYDFTDYDSTKGGKYKVDYKVTGKNKVDSSKFVYNGTIDNNGNLDNNIEYWVTSNYFSVSSNINYTLSYTSDNTNYYQFKVAWYDNNLNFIKMDYYQKGGVFNYTYLSPSNVKYCRISYSTNVSNTTATRKNIQLEEGTTATTYEPYKESIKTLYLNSPLLANDLILNSGNKIQHAHRFKQLILDGSETTWIDSERELDNTVLYAITLNDVKEVSSTGEVSTLLCDKFTTIPSSSSAGTWGVDKEGISVNMTKAVHIRIAKSKLSEVSLNGFKRWLDANPVKIIYPLKSSNYETISANDNLLLDSYTNGHLDVDSIIPIYKVVFNDSNWSLKYLYPNTEYTIQFESDNVGKIDYIYTNGATTNENNNVAKGLNKFTLTTPNEVEYTAIVTSGIGFNASKIVVTPKVDNNFGYFKGMKSVGECEDNKIEILSQNKNLWNPTINNNIINSKCEATYSNGILTIKGKGDGTNECYTNYNDNPYISQQLKPNTSYYFSYESDGEFGGVNGTDTIEAFIFGSYGKGLKFSIPPKGATFKTDDKGFTIFRFDVNKNDMTHTFYNFMLTEGTESIDYVQHKHNKKEILLNEPLRGLPNGTKDKYVLIDGKWYIERNCGKKVEPFICNDSWDEPKILEPKGIKLFKIAGGIESFTVVGYFRNAISNKFRCTTYDYRDSKFNSPYLAYITTDGNLWVSASRNTTVEQMLSYIKDCEFIYQLPSPTYEPIDYNPFEVYTDTTHISNNSTIPCNMVIKNTGYNCILKPNTKYTVSSNNGLSTVTTKDSIGDGILRFYDKDTTSITKMSNVLVLEGDYVTGNPPIPAFFKGMESAFEQELVTDEKDEHYGKYKVEVLANNGNLFDINTYESGLANIEFKNNGFRLYTTKPMPYANAIFRAKVKPFTDYRVYADIKITKGSALGDAYDSLNHWLANTFDTFNSKNNTELTIRFYCTANVSIMGDVEYTNIRLIEVGHNTDFVENKHNKIQFFLNEPLRGVGDVKDKVYVKEDKVVVERNCASITFDCSEDEYWSKYSDNTDQYRTTNRTSIFYMKIDNKKTGWNTSICNNFTNTGNSDAFAMNRCVRGMYTDHVNLNTLYFDYGYDNTITLNEFKQWLQQNPTTVVYQLATPVYEEVEYSNNRLTLNTYNNSTLFYNSNIPISNTSFKPLWEELVYIKNSTTYYIQFNAVGNGNVVVNLGGTELTTTITEGYNKIEITTPDKSTNLLTIDGQGIKISKVVVSEALCSGYYKGLQSCFEEHMENGKYVCVIRGISLDGNKVNGIKFYLNEPLRGIGDIKDRLCIKDSKLMVERNCASATFDGSDDEDWNPTGYNGHATRNTFEANLPDVNGRKGVTSSISNLFNNEQVVDIPINDNAFRVVTNAQNITYFLFTPSTNIIPYRDTNKWKEYLQQNPVKVVYQLQTPVYEEITNEYGLPIILEGYENGIVYVDSSVTPTTSIKYTSNNKVPGTLSNVDNLNTATQNDINNNIVTYMMDIDMMLTEMEMDDNASTMSLSDLDDNNQNHDSSHSNILDRMNKEDRIKYQDNTTKMLEKVIKGKSLTKDENINRIDLYLSEGKIRKEQSNYLKELLKGVE